MSLQEQDDLVPEDTPGFKVGEKKTIAEYTNLDANDESLNKWKAQLGLNSGSPLPVTPGDTRKVVILSMTLSIQGDEPIVVELENETIESLKEKKISFKIKEKSVYSLTIKFKIQQQEIITGLKYLQAVKKTGITVDKMDEPCGSYAPNTIDKPFYTKKFQEVEAPSGLLARGSYSATSKFIDDDKTVHLVLPWTFQITK